MSGMRNNNGSQDVEKYADAWAKTMVNIWKDKMNQLKVNDTGALFLSVMGVSHVKDMTGTIDFKFLEYGLYVDAGTGNGFRRGNGGDLGFHPTREPKPWFSKKFYGSYMNLIEDVGRIAAEDYTQRIVVAFK